MPLEWGNDFCVMGFHFDTATHAYTLDGLRLPSVTGILGWWLKIPFPDSPNRARGSLIHQATHLYDIGRLDLQACGDGIKRFIDSYEAVLKNFPFRWMTDLSETPMYHPTLFYAGTSDRIGTVWGEDAIGEFKTGGSDTGRTPALQTAGYAALAFRKNPERVKRYRIQLFADGKPGQVTVYKDQDDVPAFLALRTLYAWSNKKETIR